MNKNILTRTTKILLLLNKYNEQGLSARELAYKLGYTERNATHPRLTRLVRIGKVIKSSKRKDKITGRLVTIYKLRDDDNV